MNPFRGTPVLPAESNSLSFLVTKSLALVRAVAFWVAALLPLCYLPLMYVAPTSLVKLVALNGVAVLVGHGYGVGESSSGSEGPGEPR